MRKNSKWNAWLAWTATLALFGIGAFIWHHKTHRPEKADAMPDLTATPGQVTAATQHRLQVAARMADIDPAPTGELLAAIAKTGQDALVREASDLQDLRTKYAADLTAFEESQTALAAAGREGRELGERELERIHESGEAIMVTIMARQKEIFKRSSALISHYAEVRARQLGID